MKHFTLKHVAASVLSMFAILLPQATAAEFGAPVREVEVPAKTAVVAVCWLSLYSALPTGNLLEVPCPMRNAQNEVVNSVPAGKVFVIEYINTACSMHENNPVIDLGVRTNFGATMWTGLPVTHTQPFGSSVRTTGSHAVKMYAGPNTTIAGTLRRQSASAIQTYCDIRLWGHFVTLQP